MPYKRMTNEQTYEFVKLYRKYPCLWKTESPDYLDKRARRQAIESLVQEVNIPGFKAVDCQLKIKNVRSHYLQEVKKIAESENDPKGLTYAPSLNWFPVIDEFLYGYRKQHAPRLVLDPKNRIKKRRAKKHREITIDLDNDTADPSSRAMDIIKFEEISFDDPRSCSEADDERGSKSDDLKRLSAFTEADHSHLKTILENSENGDYYKNKSSSFTDGDPRGVNDLTRGIDEQEFDIFGRGVAAQLKSLPIMEAVKLQLKIQQMITEQRMSILKNPTVTESL